MILGYGLKNQEGNDSITCFQASNIFPKIDGSGKLVGYDTSIIRVYRYGKLRLYELTYLFRSTDPQGKYLYEGRKHAVVFHSDSMYGYDYDQHKEPVRRKVKIDSLFNTEWIHANKIYPIFANNICRITAKSANKNADTLYVAYRSSVE